MRKTNKLLTLILAVLIIVTAIPLSVTAEVESVEETDSNAISTAEQFLALNKAEAGANSGSYYLTKDIDFSGLKINTPYLVDEFNGVLDGKGHTIYGFELNCNLAADASVDMGVFGKLGGAETTTTIVSNLNIGKSDAPIKATVKSVNDGSSLAGAGEVRFGFLAACTGAAMNPVVNNVNIYGDLDINIGERDSANLTVGGFIGYSYHADISDSTFNGSVDITDASGATAARAIGGFVGAQATIDNETQTVINNCENFADIKVDGTTSTNATTGVGGIIGVSNGTVNLLDCINNGDITAADTAVGGIFGRFTQENLIDYALMSDCINHGTIDGGDDTCGEIYGIRPNDMGTYGMRVCIIGCMNGSVASEQNTPTYDYRQEYEHYYDYVMPMGNVNDFAKIGESDYYDIAGFYCVTNDIDFKGTTGTRTNGSYVENFDGILYGGGHTFKNLTFSKIECAFFRSTSANKNTAIVNLTLGTVNAPVQLGANNWYKAALVWKPGLNSGLYGTTVADVDIYATNTVYVYGKAGHGAFFGCSLGAYNLVDCNAYGTLSISSYLWNYMGGFIARAENTTKIHQKQNFINCNNFVDVGMNVTVETQAHYTGGFIGWIQNCKSVVFVDSNNFGDVSCIGNAPTGAGAFIGAGSASNVGINNCSNFGTVTGTRIHTMMGNVGNSVVSAVDVKDFGTVTDAGTGAERFIVSSNASVKLVDASVEKIASMRDGASIRIDENNVGIRFQSTISEESVTTLQKVYGKDAVVSYGTIIAPTAFIDAVKGEFTMAALDALAEENDAFEKGDKAYLNIPATHWFGGKNGNIAGSIVGMKPNMYVESFGARAYVNVKIGNVDVVTFYSDYDEEMNSRSVDFIAKAAYNDLSSTANSEYKYAVGNKYSCYTADQYSKIANILKANG